MLRRVFKASGKSAKSAKSAKIQGHIDFAGPDAIAGWVWDRNAPTTRLVVAWKQSDGTEREELANIYRSDLKDAGIGDGRHGFHIKLSGARPHRNDDGTFSLRVLTTGSNSSSLSGPAFGPEVEFALAPLTPSLHNRDAGIGGLQSDDLTVLLTQKWAHCPWLLLIDGAPAFHVRSEKHEPSNTKILQLRISGARKGAAAELIGFAEGTFHKLDQIVLPDPVIETEFLEQLDRVTRIARQPGSVAVTCWDGAHNPIGRAKVLYDIVSRKRPAVIVCYLHEEFGGRIWRPITNEDITILTIPWERRHAYEAAIRLTGIQFDTVWVCKPRLPSFLLASLLAAPEAKIVLDFDDNEEAFSLSPSADSRFYGKLTINLTRKLIEALPARTVASNSLQKAFGGRLVRHARDPYKKSTDRIMVAPGAPIKIGFIGTVHRHKGLIEAEQAISAFGLSKGRSVEFHVYGDVKPKELLSELLDRGVIVKSNIPMHQLNAELEKFDVILTGFPASDRRDESINKFQISSKIGDALAVGRPVMVPNGPSTCDLDEVDGVFLFNSENFEQRFLEAIEFNGKVVLPAPFTIDGAYENFAEAEAEAVPNEDLASLRVLLPNRSLGASSSQSLRPTLLLIWKQHDSGLYGRRIDQIARSYRRSHPDHDVVILELIQDQQLDWYRMNGKEMFQDDIRHVVRLAELKKGGPLDADGIRLFQLTWNLPNDMRQGVEGFLLAQGLMPQNTVVILFPIIQEVDAILPLLRPYQRIVDVVDNQIAWTGHERVAANVRQYLMLARSCDAIVFNSDENRDYFRRKEFFREEIPVEVIPNWYQLPSGYRGRCDAAHRKYEGAQIAYSGNMRDRFDFELVEELAQRLSDATIHLIGALQLRDSLIPDAFSLPNIVYHGPKPEFETLELLREMDLAIVPHILNEASAYMDPLKVEMYEAIGLPTVATNMPGISGTELVSVATSREEFVEMVISQLDVPRPIPRCSGKSDKEAAYDSLVTQLMRRAMEA